MILAYFLPPGPLNFFLHLSEDEHFCFDNTSKENSGFKPLSCHLEEHHETKNLVEMLTSAASLSIDVLYPFFFNFDPFGKPHLQLCMY